MDVSFAGSGLVADSAPFVLHGGRYSIAVDIGGASAVALMTRSPAGGDVWLPVPSLQTAPVASGDGGGTMSVAFAGDGVMTADLPPGEYKLAITHSEGAGADVALARI